MTPVELRNLAMKLRTITANKQDDVFISLAADEIVKALAEIDNLKAQLKSELAAHESWQNEYLRIDGEQCRRIRELELKLTRMTDSRDAYQEAADKLAVELKRLRDERDVELEAELGDLPRAQADMLATIKSQRKDIEKALADVEHWKLKYKES